ncbi:MAG: 4Fe-4S ferredoxin, partial [Desulfovibrionaceae bacterium]|nr:4Fe-4S ferredoxin [Desulfovibrionaceae bacterium]
MSASPGSRDQEMERQSMDADIVCVGFGPATAGFLTTLCRGLAEAGAAAESAVMPGMPPQVLCYERAEDIGFGVSGVVTRARGIRASFPDLDLSRIPMAAEVSSEKVVYLLDPVGASRRSPALRLIERLIPRGRKDHAFELPWIPSF